MGAFGLNVSRDNYPDDKGQPTQGVPGMPNPANFDILKKWAMNDVKNPDHWLVLKIRYHGCTNYEGLKILVFRGVTLEKLMQQRLIDPHFSNKKSWISPVARFEPTNMGWDMATTLCLTLSEDQ